MAQTFHSITPVEVTPGALGWQDVDCSAYIPVGATGVIVHCLNNSFGELRAIGLRKNGSTDDRTQLMNTYSHFWAMIGVDGSRVFQAKVGDTTDNDIYLIGYTTTGVTFKTNADDMSLGATGAWTSIDCSTEAPSATGVIFEVATPAGHEFGLRKNGSGDDRHQIVSRHLWAIIGCDNSQIIEGYIEHTDVDFFLVGYVTDGATFKTNADDMSLGATGVYTDIDCSVEAPNAIMIFMEVATATAYFFGLRENGQSGGYYDTYLYAYKHPWAFVKCDGSQVIEGKISNVALDFFLVGYAEPAAAPPIAPKGGSVAAKMMAAGVI